VSEKEKDEGDEAARDDDDEDRAEQGDEAAPAQDEAEGGDDDTERAARVEALGRGRGGRAARTATSRRARKKGAGATARNDATGARDAEAQEPRRKRSPPRRTAREGRCNRRSASTKPAQLDAADGRRRARARGRNHRAAEQSDDDQWSRRGLLGVAGSRVHMQKAGRIGGVALRAMGKRLHVTGMASDDKSWITLIFAPGSVTSGPREPRGLKHAARGRDLIANGRAAQCASGQAIEA
jgi:hypothetical protein